MPPAAASAEPAALALPPTPVGGPSASPAQQELYLEVTLNGVPTGRVSRFVQQGARFFAEPQVLREIGLKWPGNGNGNGEGAVRADASGLISLDALTGLQAAYDTARQQMLLVAPVELLDRPAQALSGENTQRPRVDPATLVPGLLVNYDIYGQHTDGLSALSASTDMRVFGVGPGIWNNTLLTQASSGNALGRRGRNVRLDTSWQLDDPEDMTTLTIGDTATGSLAWTRGLRIGGVRLSRNFSLQPYRVTAPLAAFEGSAVLPSTVDLFINGVRQSSQQVQPGEFRLNSIPSLNGSGQAEMVITDLNGQRRLVSFDLYGTPQLLQAGLSDWSLDLGAVRRDYGLKSFSYDDSPVFSASLRHGWNDRITYEAHAEVAPGLQLGGVGGVWLLGDTAGVLSASAAASQRHGRSGGQGTLGYQWSSRDFNLALNTLRANAGYRDAASLYSTAMLRASDTAYLGMSSRWGQFGLSLIRQQYEARDAIRLGSLSWTRQLPGSATVSVGINRSLGAGIGTSVQATWSMPLDRRVSVGASVFHDGESSRVAADAVRSLPGDGSGWGWRVQAVAGDINSGQAEVSRTGDYGQWSAGLSHLGGGQGAVSNALFGSASGGVVWMQDRVTPMRRVDDAFAVVSTSGVPDVPVRLENRLIGSTDGLGLLFVTRLNAWQANRLSIDTLGLPSDMRVEREMLDAVPPARSGMLARFDVRRTLAVSLGLRDRRGDWVPMGSAVTLESPGAAADASATRQTVVGYDGLVYLENPPPGSILRVQTEAGTCRAPLPRTAESFGTVDLGVLSCR